METLNGKGARRARACVCFVVYTESFFVLSFSIFQTKHYFLAVLHRRDPSSLAKTEETVEKSRTFPYSVSADLFPILRW